MKLKTILIIDDSVFDRLIASEVIKNSMTGNNIIALESAEEGLEYILNKTDNPAELPDIIFLDIKMPKVDGFEFLERYEKLIANTTALSKIYMLSSSIDPDDINKALKSKHVLDFIEKPLTKEKIEKIWLTL